MDITSTTFVPKYLTNLHNDMLDIERQYILAKEKYDNALLEYKLSKQILYMLFRYLPGEIRGYILAIHRYLSNESSFTIHNIPRDLYDTDDCVSGYIQYTSWQLPSKKDINDYILNNEHVSMLVYFTKYGTVNCSHHSIYRIERNKPGIYIKCIDGIFKIHSHKFITDGRKILEQSRTYNFEMENVMYLNTVIDVIDIARYYKYKFGITNIDHIRKMSIRYIDFVLSKYELYMKLEYLVLNLNDLYNRLDDTYYYISSGICNNISKLECTEKNYNKLYQDLLLVFNNNIDKILN